MLYESCFQRLLVVIARSLVASDGGRRRGYVRSASGVAIDATHWCVSTCSPSTRHVINNALNPCYLEVGRLASSGCDWCLCARSALLFPLLLLLLCTRRVWQSSSCHVASGLNDRQHRYSADKLSSLDILYIHQLQASYCWNLLSFCVLCTWFVW